MYTLRETWASFKRNVTLTVAAIITSAVSLLIFGLTLLIQHGFDNLLQRWEGGVEMIVFVNAGTQPDGLQFIEDQLNQQVGTSIESWSYCDVECSLEDADRVLAGDPTTRQLLTPDTIPTLFKIVPVDGTDVVFLRGLKETYSTFPSVYNVTLAEEQLDLISKLQNFVSTYTTGLWIALMFASGLLIWNTIRTAMFARRREIEVMKLVGATDWFIRWPFVIEGMLVGALGGMLAVLLLAVVKIALVDPLAADFALIAAPQTMNFPLLIAVLLGASVAVSALGSGISLRRFLRV